MKVECVECFTIFEESPNATFIEMFCSDACRDAFDTRLKASNAIVDKMIANDSHSLRLIHTPQSTSSQNLLTLIKATRPTQETDLNSQSKVGEKKDD
jgi:hypothetical protein